jgi:hypothetical protein
MSNHFLRQLEGFEENGNGNGRKKRNLLSIHYLRRIIVCDGIVKVDFFVQEVVWLILEFGFPKILTILTKLRNLTEFPHFCLLNVS